MKYSMWSSFLRNRPPHEAVSLFLEHGFHCTEISFEHIAGFLKSANPSKAASEFRRFCDNLAFQIPQGHLIFPEVDLAEPDEERRLLMIDRWKKELELFEILGVERAVIHPGGHASFLAGVPCDRIDALRLDSLERLTSFTKGMKVQLCLENVLDYMCVAEELLAVIRELNADNIGICLDTGHLNIRRTQTHADFIRACGPRLQALHIADNHGQSDEHLFPYGGSIDWREVNDALNEIAYDRLYNLEVPGENCIPELCGPKLDYALKLSQVVFHRP